MWVKVSDREDPDMEREIENSCFDGSGDVDNTGSRIVSGTLLVFNFFLLHLRASIGPPIAQSYTCHCAI